MGLDKYLFLCEHGEKRSPTCARVAREMLKSNEKIEITYGAYSVVRDFRTSILPHLQSFSKIFVFSLVRRLPPQIY
jgi:hypothetical protein